MVVAMSLQNRKRRLDVAVEGVYWLGYQNPEESIDKGPGRKLYPKNPIRAMENESDSSTGEQMAAA